MLSKHIQSPNSEKAHSYSWYCVEWASNGPGHLICLNSIKHKKSPSIYPLSLPETPLMGYGFVDKVAISFPTVLPQKSMEMCFRRRGLSSSMQQLILTRTLQLMRHTGSLPTTQMPFHLGLQSNQIFIRAGQGRERNLQWFLKKSIVNIGFSLF